MPNIITMAHGGGGFETRRLIESIFATRFGSINIEEDAFVFQRPPGEGAFTTDSFVVDPLFFAGGDIGKLSICGTVNDLLTTGAESRYISVGFIIEEGLPLETLENVADSMRKTADCAGVRIVTGDTKVINRAKDRDSTLYINTAGIGFIRGERVTFKNAVAGDALIVTGNLGDHHACVLSHRMKLKNDIKSDVAPLCSIVSGLREQLCINGMRDITRGGLAGVLNELCGAEIDESALPVSDSVAALCKILGLDPLYMGNEGNMLIAVSPHDADKALGIIRSHEYGTNAAVIGTVTDEDRVVLKTRYGRRMLPPMIGEGLPRIC